MMLKEESKKQLITRATQYGVDPLSHLDERSWRYILPLFLPHYILLIGLKITVVAA